MWKTIRSYIPKKPANVKSFTKDDQSVANEFNRFLSSVGKSTMEKIQLLAKISVMFPRKISVLRKIIDPVSDQFSFTTVECSQVKILLIQYLTRKPQELTKCHLA